MYGLATMLALLYWILVNSCLAYSLMTWANGHAQAGFVLAYSALQPTTACLLSVLIVSAVGAEATSLEMPGYNALGGIAVAIMLAYCVLMIATNNIITSSMARRPAVSTMTALYPLERLKEGIERLLLNLNLVI